MLVGLHDDGPSVTHVRLDQPTNDHQIFSSLVFGRIWDCLAVYHRKDSFSRLLTMEEARNIHKAELVLLRSRNFDL